MTAMATKTEAAMAGDQEFSELVVALLWRHHRSQGWLASKMGVHRGTIRDKLRGRNGNRWRDLEERRRVAEVLATTLDVRGLPRLDSNQQPAGYRPPKVA